MNGTADNKELSGTVDRQFAESLQDLGHKES